MKLRAFAITLAALLTSASVSEAAFMTTNLATFNAIIQPGHYLETFDGFTNASFSSPQTLSSGGFTYTVNVPGGGSPIYTSGGGTPNGFLGTNSPNQPITLLFTSGNVSAVGGNFFNTNASDVTQATPVTITTNDGTTTTITPSGQFTGSFVGFYTADPSILITSLVYSAPTVAGNYASIDNIDVGQVAVSGPPAGGAVPVPATALFGLAAMPLIGLIRRKRA